MREMLLPEYQRTGGATGYVCAQVNPSRTGHRATMLEMARRFHEWTPNITVKLPGASLASVVPSSSATVGLVVCGGNNAQ
jgi:hypothetical protein